MNSAQRTCPGRHSETHPPPALRNDEYLCRHCTRRVGHQLRQIEADVADLELTIARQSVGPRVVSGRTGGESPLPWNEGASDARGEVISFLRAWAEFVAEDRHAPLEPLPRSQQGRQVDLERSVRGLLAHPDWPRSHEQGPALADTVAACRRRLHNASDRRDERRFAGTCGAQVFVGVLRPRVSLVRGETEWPLELVGEQEGRCPLALFDQRGEDVITCDGFHDPLDRKGCGAKHSAAARKVRLLEAAADVLVPLDLILASLERLTGRNPDKGTVRQWRHSGKLAPRGSRAGVQLYRAGDVIDLALDERPRRGPRRRRDRRV